MACVGWGGGWGGAAGGMALRGPDNFLYSRFSYRHFSGDGGGVGEEGETTF